MDKDELLARIDAHFHAEAQAAKAEYSAPSHADKARFHAERWRHLDEAGKLIERLP